MADKTMTDSEILHKIQLVYFANSSNCAGQLAKIITDLSREERLPSKPSVIDNGIQIFSPHQLYLLGLAFYKFSLDSNHIQDYKSVLTNSAIMCFDVVKNSDCKECEKATYYLSILLFSENSIHKKIPEKYIKYTLLGKQENINYGDIQGLKEIEKSQSNKGHSPTSFACKSKIARQLINMAQKGIAPAQMQLAEIYLEGKGVPRSLTHAYAWAEIARINGQPESIKISNIIKNEIYADEVRAEAKIKAADMLEANPELYEDVA